MATLPYIFSRGGSRANRKLRVHAFLLACVLVLAPWGLKAQQQSAVPLPDVSDMLRTGRCAEAKTQLETYLTNHQESADAHYLLGYALYCLKDPTHSLEQYTAAAALRKPTASDLMDVAADYILLSDYADAAKWLGQATAWEPNNRLAWYYLGRALFSDSRYPEAIQAFQKVLALQPKDVAAETNLGLSYEALGDAGKALESYGLAIEWQKNAASKDQQPYLRSGALLRKQGHPEQALPFLVEACKLGADNPSAREELGMTYEQLGREQEAREQIERAVSLQGDSPSLHFLLGRIYRKLGMQEAAQAEFAATNRLMKGKSAPDVTNYNLQK